MNITLMRKIDKYLGMLALICLLPLKLIYYLASHKKKLKPKKIFISKYFGMGSIILATPLIKALKRKYKDAKICLVTFESNRKFCEGIEEIDEIISFNTNNMVKFFIDVFKFIFSFHRPNYFIDLEFYSNFPLIISMLSGAAVRLGFCERHIFRTWYLNIHVHFNHTRHITEIFYRFAIRLGIKKTNLWDFSKLKYEKSNKDKILEFTGSYSKIITVNPCASDLFLLRRWPQENFVYLINKLCKDSKTLIVIIGGNEDKSFTKSLLNKVNPKNENVINLAGKLALQDTFALLDMTDLFITNDSGPLHWAIAIGTKTVSFFGPESPDLYGPPKTKNHKCFYTHPYCSPCMNVLYEKHSSCKNNICLQEIKPNKVYKIVEKLI